LLKKLPLFAVANVAYLFNSLQVFLKIFFFFFSLYTKVINSQAHALLIYFIHFSVLMK